MWNAERKIWEYGGLPVTLSGERESLGAESEIKGKWWKSMGEQCLFAS